VEKEEPPVAGDPPVDLLVVAVVPPVGLLDPPVEVGAPPDSMNNDEDPATSISDGEELSEPHPESIKTRSIFFI
jgi:hypothetical protein